MKTVNWNEAARSAELLVHRYSAVLAEQALRIAFNNDQDASRPTPAEEAERQPLPERPQEPDEAERLEASVARHLDRAHAIQERLAGRPTDPALGAELAALRTDFLDWSRRLDREFAQLAGSQEPCAARLSRLRALGDQLSFAAYALGLWGPGTGMAANAAIV